MTELKLRRLLEHNQRLKEDLARPRIRVSEASARFVYTFHGILIRMGRSFVSDFTSLIRYCKTTTDHLVSPQCVGRWYRFTTVWETGPRFSDLTSEPLSVVALPGRAFLSQPRVLTLTASALADRCSCPCRYLLSGDLSTRQKTHTRLRLRDVVVP